MTARKGANGDRETNGHSEKGLLRHPLIVAAFVGVLAVFGGWLASPSAQVLRDKPQEQELKVNLVAEMAKATAEATNQGLALCANDLPGADVAGAPVPSQASTAADRRAALHTAAELAYTRWITTAVIVDTKLDAYFPAFARGV